MFERLTDRTGNGQIYLIEELEEDMYGYYTEKGLKQIEKVIDRLAVYEDSGLSPEQARELAKAKADGRLVELPCKVGDIGWQITECFDGDRGCQGNCDECPKKKTVVSFRFISKAHIVRHVEKGDFSKTVFLTREAAENAIAEVGE
jgi:hypothetical protein